MRAATPRGAGSSDAGSTSSGGTGGRGGTGGVPHLGQIAERPVPKAPGRSSCTGGRSQLVEQSFGRLARDDWGRARRRTDAGRTEQDSGAGAHLTTFSIHARSAKLPGMRGAGLLLELQVKRGFEEQFLSVTRLYRLHTVASRGCFRFELLQRDDAARSFLIHQIFRDDRTLRSHATAEHTRSWLRAMDVMLEGEPIVRRVSRLAAEPLPPRSPPPLPNAFLETASVWPEHADDRFGWRPVASTFLASEAAASSAGPNTRQAPKLGSTLPRLQLVVSRLEIACATETSLWGRPRPCLVVGCYKIGSQQAEGLGRAIYRFGKGMAPPCELARDDRLLDVSVLFEHYPLRVGVLVLGLEENGGSTIRTVFQDLAEPEQFMLWRAPEPEPNPRRLADHCASAALNLGERVHVVHDGASFSESVSDDYLVGASMAVVEFTALGQERVIRCHTVSASRENDWMSVFRISLA